MTILEEVSGNRVHYSANILGGVKYDISDAQRESIRCGLDFLEDRTRHYINVVAQDEFFLRRTRGIGRMTAEQAEKLCVVGPTARASGLMRDIRVEAPYAAYVDFPVNALLFTTGDLEARIVIRLQELLETYRLIRTLIENMPASELETRMPRRIKEGETISRVEAPRGELLYFIRSNGTDTPDRIRVRTPTIFNMASVLSLVIGQQLADVPMLLVGIDPCFSCNDRMIWLSGEREQQWSWEQFRQYGIEFYRRTS
jgi:NADH-quinone oxidoreductase subunit D